MLSHKCIGCKLHERCRKLDDVNNLTRPIDSDEKSIIFCYENGGETYFSELCELDDGISTCRTAAQRRKDRYFKEGIRGKERAWRKYIRSLKPDIVTTLTTRRYKQAKYSYINAD